MLIWINGALGVGKTTAAAHVRQLDTRWRLFDPEWVGFMLRANLDGVAFDDFQDLPALRTLVPPVAEAVIEQTGDDLLAAQTVLVANYWSDIRAGLANRGVAVMHVVLDADGESLRARIAADNEQPAAAPWRLDHVQDYLAARSWLLDDADLVIDAAGASPRKIARSILVATK